VQKGHMIMPEDVSNCEKDTEKRQLKGGEQWGIKS
jgi:hypothetical protein